MGEEETKIVNQQEAGAVLSAGKQAHNNEKPIISLPLQDSQSFSNPSPTTLSISLSLSILFSSFCLSVHLFFIFVWVKIPKLKCMYGSLGVIFVRLCYV